MDKKKLEKGKKGVTVLVRINQPGRGDKSARRVLSFFTWKNLDVVETWTRKVENMGPSD